MKLIRITTVPISLKVLLKGQLRFMSRSGFEVVGISADGKELKAVEHDEDIRTIAVEMTRTISPLKDLKAVWMLYKIFKIEKPSIVHTHTPKAGIVGMVASWFARVPIRIHTVAGLPLMEASGYKRILLNFVERLTYFCATNIYPNSKGLHSFILNNKLTQSKKLKVIGEGSSNGIDTSHFSPDQISKKQKELLKQELKIDNFVFIFIGRVVKDKGINELIKAFLQINENQNEGSRAKLLIVGDFESTLDPVLPETEAEVRNNPDIIFVGYQSDVRPYLSVSHCLAFPSYREGFPNVVMQAGAMGIPAIVTNINGCNEIIIEDKNGIIIPPKNVVELKRAMTHIMNDRGYYLSLKKNARHMITKRYEQRAVWETLLAEYKRLLQGKK